MSDPFSYLLEERSAPFFQKVACSEAGVRPAPTPAMTKTAGAQPTPFQKIARQLDRAIEIIESCGKCGANAGMQKRADAYIDLLLNGEVELTPEEFGEVFDKVAAAAIQGDLDALYTELCSEVDEEYYPVVEAELAKIGRDLTSMALMEKEALIGALRGGLGAVKGVARYLGRGAAKPFVAAGKGLKQRAGAAGAAVKKNAPFVGTKAREARHLKTISAPDKARAELARVQAATQAGGLRGAAAQGALPAAQKNVEVASTKARKALGWKKDVPAAAAAAAAPASSAAAPAGTTAARGAAAPSAAAASEAKTIRAEGERAKAQGDAATAAQPKSGKPNLTVHEGGKGKGTGTDGPAPAVASKPKDATPPPPGGADDKPPGFMDAWKKATNQGWGQLSAAEKGALVRGGVTAAIVYRAATGKGAVTGDEGVI